MTTARSGPSTHGVYACDPVRVEESVVTGAGPARSEDQTRLFTRRLLPPLSENGAAALAGLTFLVLFVLPYPAALIQDHSAALAAGLPVWNVPVGAAIFGTLLCALLAYAARRAGGDAWAGALAGAALAGAASALTVLVIQPAFRLAPTAAPDVTGVLLGVTLSALVALRPWARTASGACVAALLGAVTIDTLARQSSGAAVPFDVVLGIGFGLLLGQSVLAVLWRSAHGESWSGVEGLWLCAAVLLMVYAADPGRWLITALVLGGAVTMLRALAMRRTIEPDLPEPVTAD